MKKIKYIYIWVYSKYICSSVTSLKYKTNKVYFIDSVKWIGLGYFLVSQLFQASCQEGSSPIKEAGEAEGEFAESSHLTWKTYT